MFNKVIVSFVALEIVLLLIVLANYIMLEIQIRHDVKMHRKEWIEIQKYKYLLALRD